MFGRWFSWERFDFWENDQECLFLTLHLQQCSFCFYEFFTVWSLLFQFFCGPSSQSRFISSLWATSFLLYIANFYLLIQIREVKMDPEPWDLNTKKVRNRLLPGWRRKCGRRCNRRRAVERNDCRDKIFRRRSILSPFRRRTIRRLRSKASGPDRNRLKSRRDEESSLKSKRIYQQKFTTKSHFHSLMKFTVKPVYNDHSRDPKFAAVVDRWLLFRGSLML